jgi:FKBP-type peptidyl-prolyl cis-trans isomerase (trigger factor)
MEKVRLSYILSRIADEEKINTSDNEVTERIKAMAPRYGMTPERLTADLEKANGIERLKSDLRAEKTLDFILANAKIKN